MKPLPPNGSHFGMSPEQVEDDSMGVLTDLQRLALADVRIGELERENAKLREALITARERVSARDPDFDTVLIINRALTS
jgi:hypothetical protein